MQKGKGYFHREEGEIIECLKSDLDIFIKGSIETSIVNGHTVSHKPIAPSDSAAQLEFNCWGIVISILN